MGSLRRIFEYVWPQWPRIIVVVISALIVSLLLSLSLVTVMPLLKVMMGKEGLHGWVDRENCSIRYGMDFDVPEKTDFISDNAGDIAYYLLVTKVDKGSLASAAGFKEYDRIVGAGDVLIENDIKRVISSKLFEELAATNENRITVQVRRTKEDGTLEGIKLYLNTYPDESQSLQLSRFKSAKWTVKMALVGYAQSAVSILPREQTKDNKLKSILFIIALMAGVTIVRCLAKFYQGYMAQKIVQVGLNHLRVDSFSHVMNLPISFFANDRPSDTVSRLIRDIGVMGKAVKIILGKALREPLNALFMLLWAMWLNWQLTLIFLCGAPMALGLVVIFGRKMKRATRKSLMAWSQMLAKLQETISGLKVVKVYNRQDYERENFKLINKKLLKQLLKISRVDAATSPVMEVLGMFAGCAALMVGAHWVIKQEQMDGEEFLLLLLLLGAAAEAVRKTSDIWNKIQEANAASERVFSTMDALVEPEGIGAAEQPSLKEKIEFKDVVFTYPGSNEPVLKGINLTVEAGHNVAVVGPNGSGKTTLVNLLPRFYDVDSGTILIDGHDICGSTLKSLRSRIGMVTQNVVTFNDTISANIAYGKVGATKEQIIEAAKRSYAHEFIEPLPNGYDTVIGEDGVGLSGGQLQRIIIARAILKNPEILIFDEATSQVDADSEAKIHKAIEEVMRDRTSFIIAHRFSTVITANVIVVMDNGKIIAQGQHEKLFSSCKLYQSLYETQLIAK
ncbi:MAG: ABC transporter transmembrane domain-containing protein [Planctomycetota bacterium]|jgi:ABC-type multidrug transport system fused ATPase/permease subunit